MNVSAFADTSSQATVVICGFILVLFVIGLRRRSGRHTDKRPVDEVTESLPGVIISLGIFGTFLGIYLGLRDFDASDIASSIPPLLEGLKTAFLTSLFGMFFSLTLRWRYGIYDNIEAAATETQTRDPFVLLQAIAATLTSLDANVKAMGETVVRCFRSDEEYSLLSQLKLIRSDVNDLGREVRKSLDDFGQKVAQLGTEALVNSLKEVIEQFNAKLSDLVGAEFRQLRDAMIKLTEWQEHHRRAVDEMQARLNEHLQAVRETTRLLEHVATSVQKTSIHLEEIDGSLAGMSVSAADVAAHVESLKGQNQQLSGLLLEINRLGAEAEQVLPNISAHLNEAVVALKQAATDAKEKITESGMVMGQSVEGVSTKMLDLTTKHAAQVDHSLKQLEEGLQKALDTSLTSLGGQLAALSSKFAQDYTPLTDRLREVVRIAQKVNSDVASV